MTGPCQGLPHLKKGKAWQKGTKTKTGLFTGYRTKSGSRTGKWPGCAGKWPGCAGNEIGELKEFWMEADAAKEGI